MELGDQKHAFRNVLNGRVWFHRRRNFGYRYAATNIIFQLWVCLYVLFIAWIKIDGCVRVWLCPFHVAGRVWFDICFSH
jgi:hypothetical protein